MSLAEQVLGPAARSLGDALGRAAGGVRGATSEPAGAPLAPPGQTAEARERDLQNAYFMAQRALADLRRERQRLWLDRVAVYGPQVAWVVGAFVVGMAVGQILLTRMMGRRRD